jgi:hypothetical protein
MQLWLSSMVWLAEASASECCPRKRAEIADANLGFIVLQIPQV